MAPAVASATARAVEIVVELLADRPDREPRLGGESLSPVGTEKLVRTPLLLSEKGEAETSPRLGAGVVIILSDYLGLDSHYNHQHLILTVGPRFI